jgi:hypothetical protein
MLWLASMIAVIFSVTVRDSVSTVCGPDFSGGGGSLPDCSLRAWSSRISGW